MMIPQETATAPAQPLRENLAAHHGFQPRWLNAASNAGNG